MSGYFCILFAYLIVSNITAVKMYFRIAFKKSSPQRSLSKTLGHSKLKISRGLGFHRLWLFFPEIKSLFVHPFLAERIISMLNYFLQHLVGPKMGALKVKDFSEFDFKPQQLVSDICTIYLNLGYLRFKWGRLEGLLMF